MQATEETRAHIHPIGALKSLAVLAALASVSALLLQWVTGWSLVPAAYIFFYASAAVAVLVCYAFPIASQSAYQAVSAFVARRGAFRSHPVVERPKFALIRFLFGAFMAERAIWIIVYLYPSDWNNPLLLFLVFANLTAAIFVTFGFLTQIALAYLILIQWQFGDAVLGTSTLGNDIGAMLALLLLLANAGASFSIDSWLMKRRSPLSAVFGTFYFAGGIPSAATLQHAKLIAIVSYWCVCMYSLMSHLAEPAWMTGTAGPHLLTSNYMSRFAAEFEWLFQQSEWALRLGQVGLWAMLPWYVLLLPCLFLGRAARAYAIGWGLLFFTLSLCVLQLGWLAHFEFLLFAALFWERRFMQEPGSLKVAYDDRCNLCDRTVTFIKWADIFRRVELKPVSRNGEWLRENGISEAEALTDLYGVENSKGGRRSHGYEFYITLSRNVFLLLPFYPVLLLGRVTGIGPWIYRKIADRRVRLFGVCQLATPKPNHEVLPASAGAPASPAGPAIALHAYTLALTYLVMLPAPSAGWTGLPLPEPAREVLLVGATAAHQYGITPIDVFNRTDLRMEENWYTLSITPEAGDEALLPIFSETGGRLTMHSSDRIYVGNTLPWRRAMIGSEGCQLDPYREQIENVAAYHLARSAPDSVFTYRQYRQPLAADEEILAGQFRPAEIELVCELNLELAQ
jgi:predicted DCC family thiol-disulfide oxidoreductase YuxK